ncbi:MAG: LamG domain-containing protein [Candidatus Sumerlaeaceae bacterium]
MSGYLKFGVALLLFGIGIRVVAQPNTAALSFNGVSDYVALTTSPATDLLNGYTIEAWAYPSPPTTYTTGARRIISNDQQNPARGFGLGMTSSTISGVSQTRWRFTTFGVKDYDTTAVSAALNTWSHVAMTFDTSNTVTFYVNGAFGQSIPFATDARISTAPMNIGRNPVGTTGTEFWPGMIDEIRFWNYVRTQPQIQADMNRQLAGNEPGLIGYWPLNEAAGIFTEDKSVNSADGTLSGATWTSGPLIYGPLTAVREDWSLFQ